MLKEPGAPIITSSESNIDCLMKINSLASVIPEDHLEFYKSVIYQKIAEHIKRIFTQENWAGELSEKDLNHVHIYFPGEYDDPRNIEKMREKENDISYLYHSKELKEDTTKRNIFIDNHGRFEALDDNQVEGALGTEGQEIVTVFFSDSFEKMKKMTEECRGFLDRNSIYQVGDLFFATSNRNYR